MKGSSLFLRSELNKPFFAFLQNKTLARDKFDLDTKKSVLAEI